MSHVIRPASRVIPHSSHSQVLLISSWITSGSTHTPLQPKHSGLAFQCSLLPTFLSPRALRRRCCRPQTSPSSSLETPTITSTWRSFWRRDPTSCGRCRPSCACRGPHCRCSTRVRTQMSSSALSCCLLRPRQPVELKEEGVRQCTLR